MRASVRLPRDQPITINVISVIHTSVTFSDIRTTSSSEDDVITKCELIDDNVISCVESLNVVDAKILFLQFSSEFIITLIYIYIELLLLTFTQGLDDRNDGQSFLFSQLRFNFEQQNRFDLNVIPPLLLCANRVRSTYNVRKNMPAKTQKQKRRNGRWELQLLVDQRGENE